MKEPLYTKGDRVTFIFNGIGEPIEGNIEVVDITGTLFDRSEVSCDIRALGWGETLYKHVFESHILGKSHNGSMVRGVLQYDPDAELFQVLYGNDGYGAIIDQPFMDIRLAGRGAWQSWPDAPLKRWLGKTVELRNRTVHIRRIIERVTDQDMVEEMIIACARHIGGTGGIFNPDTITENGFSYDRRDMHRVIYERPYILDITYKEIPFEKE